MQSQLVTVFVCVTATRRGTVRRTDGAGNGIRTEAIASSTTTGRREVTGTETAVVHAVEDVRRNMTAMEAHRLRDGIAKDRASIATARKTDAVRVDD